MFTKNVADLKCYWDEYTLPFDKKELAEKYFEELIAHYSGNDRHYHGLNHILDCVDKLFTAYTTVKSLTKPEFKLIFFSILFHDAIYSTQVLSNSEAASAHLARKCLFELGMDVAEIELIAAFINYTTHNIINETKDLDKLIFGTALGIFLDIDIRSGMDCSYEEFLKHGENIRKEYSQYSDEEFKEGRKKFFNKLLEKKNILFTWNEAKIRSNINQYLLEN